MMKISIVGTGYVGLSTAVGFAMKGHDVTCIDVDRSKVALVNNGKAPFYEKGIEEGIAAAIKDGRLRATADYAAVKDSEITFICVGTPSDKEGRMDVSYVKAAAESIGKAMTGKPYHAVVVKSTVVPGTTRDIVLPILAKHSKSFGLCMNPEFLREGMALDDFLNPDRIVIGEMDAKSGDTLMKAYQDFNAPFVRVPLSTAEMIKYASNTFLAARISLINEIGNVCKKLGIDVYDVARALGQDRRIGPHFLEAGVGFGGSCFPKDVSALMRKTEELGTGNEMMKAVLGVNAGQRRVIVHMLRHKLPLKGAKVAVLGVAFKHDSDDVRESPAIDIIKTLKREGADVWAYDPQALENAKKAAPEIKYASREECLKDADACLLLTNWAEFRSMEDKDFAAMKSKIIIEGRRILDRKKVSGYEGMCW